ncbi:hypothetical protein [uncultured Tateyamaria sp.]|uniref:hypothetical protein n=1 Tax=uncultured Tateyamaria sp. TaxID=455651 RepID=UPI0026320D07|nr:hypothetical protein [uncultured Tateyamaria sp.]
MQDTTGCCIVSDGRSRAQGGRCLFSLRDGMIVFAHAASFVLRARAARETALGAARSLNQVSKLQVAGQGRHWNLTLAHAASIRKCSAFIAALQTALANWVF